MACGQRGSMLAWLLAPEAVGMIPAYTAMLTPCWQPKSCGHQQTGYMTVKPASSLRPGKGPYMTTSFLNQFPDSLVRRDHKYL